MPRTTCLTLLLTCSALAGCGGATDPFDRPGTLRARGLNDANLRAMIADPSHLERGVATTTERGAAAATGVGLLRNGRRRELPGAPAQGSPVFLPSAAGQNGNR
ncbi:hypothetical protein [Falsiroseomonas tokyonensis]|uniref:Uncharacterized protein n=1 Tax=Falsiroseomonas tokyonensis TaxID=430521 RepID=A0ABV7BTK3_9PROT|nr:hypothetical protein [Falsiroseomonas tokyonensis]MBU8537353.1 hypothetical protein [Falsiroseomonas tokyonensis]